MLVSLSSSFQTGPNFWLNFQNGVNYQVAVQTPQYKMDTLNDLENTPIVTPAQPTPQLLGNLATFERRESPIIVNHYNVQPVFDVLANTQDRDLGGIAADVNKAVDEFDPKPGLLRKTAEAVGLGGWLDKHGWLKTPGSKHLRFDHHGPWPGGQPALMLRGTGFGHQLRHRAGLFPHGGQFPELD